VWKTLWENVRLYELEAHQTDCRSDLHHRGARKLIITTAANGDALYSIGLSLYAPSTIAIVTRSLLKT